MPKYRSMELAESVSQLMQEPFESVDLDEMAIAQLQAALDDGQLTEAESDRFLGWTNDFGEQMPGDEGVPWRLEG